MDPLSDKSLASNWTAAISTLVSLNDTEDNMKLKFYPSPVRDNFTIESSGIIKTMEMYDSQGKLLDRIDLNSEVYKLDMNSCHSGIYMIREITQEGSFISKIIKNKSYILLNNNPINLLFIGI